MANFYNAIAIKLTDATTTSIDSVALSGTTDISIANPVFYFTTSAFSSTSSISTSGNTTTTAVITPAFSATNSISTTQDGTVVVEESTLSGFSDISSVFQVGFSTDAIVGIAGITSSVLYPITIVDDSAFSATGSIETSGNLETILSYSGELTGVTSLDTEPQVQSLAPELSGAVSIGNTYGIYTTIVDDSTFTGTSSITTIGQAILCYSEALSGACSIDCDGVNSNYGTLTGLTSMSCDEGGLYIWNYYGTFLSDTDLNTVFEIDFATQEELETNTSFTTVYEIQNTTPIFTATNSINGESGFVGYFSDTPVFTSSASLTTNHQTQVVSEALSGSTDIDSIFEIHFSTDSSLTGTVEISLTETPIVYNTSTAIVKYKCYINGNEYDISSWQARSQAHGKKTSYYLQVVIPSTDSIPAVTGTININMIHLLPDGTEAVAGQMIWAPVETVNRNVGTTNESITVQGSRVIDGGLDDPASSFYTEDKPISRTEQNGTITTRFVSLPLVLYPNAVANVYGGSYLAQTISMYVSESGSYTDVIGISL